MRELPDIVPPPPSALPSPTIPDDAPSVVERFALAQTQARLVGGPAPLIRLGRYILLERLGAGGMGTVFAAYDPQLDRRIAIKVVHPGNTTARASDRLAREARALARLSHPNIVTVFDAGVVGAEVFVAMELLAGRTLRQWCAQPRSWREVRDLLLSAAQGLAAAHGAGLIHRDFKPANVIIGDDERVRVLDFGLAHLSSELPLAEGGTPTGPMSTLTTVGNVMGTPAYMAPEQLLHGISNAHSDQYSFFVTFYEALYGVRPCPSENLTELVRTLVAPQLPTAPPRRGTPAWLHRAILRGLSPQPADRFASMGAVIDELNADRSRRRRRTIVALCGVLVAGAAGIGVRAAWPSTPASDGEANPVSTLIQQARAAASRSYFVYGPVDDAEQPTAFQVVIALEALDDPSGAARGAATDLRTEFADTLVRLGDQFWERPGGAPFSADYYAMALVFDAQRQRARARTSLTPGELQSLTQRAAAGSFSDAERLAGESLAVLAEPNAEEQARRVAQLADRDHAPAPTTLARLSELVSAEQDPAAEGGAFDRPTRSPREARSDSAGAPAPRDRVSPDVRAEESTAPAAGGGSPRRRADQLVAEAASKARAGKLQESERLYREALRIHKAHAGALAGLARLSFDRGAYHAALQYARRASKAAPKRRDVLILRGDAAYRVDYYEEARRAYIAAQKLGSKTARARLEYIDGKLGTK